MRRFVTRLTSLGVWNKAGDHTEPSPSCSSSGQHLLPPQTRGGVCQGHQSDSTSILMETLEWRMRSLRAMLSNSFSIQYSGCSFGSPVLSNPATNADGGSMSPPTATKPNRGKKNTHTYDFVIIGCGNAGASALKTLRASCPNAKIAIVDPIAGTAGLAKRFKADFWCGRAASLNQDWTVEVEAKGDSSFLSYRHAVLVATGSRGSPPPYYLVDEQCDGGDVLELRPTSYGTYGDSFPPTKEYVYSQAITGKHKVCILGSGWEAMELLARTTLSRKRENRPCLVLGCNGPLSRVLPNYLSSAVSKRFKSKGVEVAVRSLVRYISRTRDGKLQIYTAKSYDFLDGNAIACDKVIIAPDVEGQRGTAMLPTDEIPEFLIGSTKGRPWYQSWAHLSPPTVTCYQDDGRILVNTELCAASGVYAAGSVAKFPNDRTGNAAVAGFGIHDGAQAGVVAGKNMAILYWNSRRSSNISPVSLVKDSIPVWSSDTVFPDEESALQQVGVQALCVGNCEAESLSTHGIWWTNQAAQRRLLGSFNGNDTEFTERKQVKRKLQVVYGLGFVFYLDGNGKIHGIMAWGLPFRTRTGKEWGLNIKLIARMKSMIISNGGFRVVESEQDFIRMSSYLEEQAKQMTYLAFSASRQSNNNGESHRLGSKVADMPRPLHRYTDIRPANVRSLGYHRARDGRAHGVTGENLFSREESDDVPDAPVPEPDMSRNVGAAAAKVKALYDWNVWVQSELRWEDNETRARPPKEDPLWIRKGDEARNITQKDRLATAYHNILGTPSG